jgi:hypothetical protein
MLLKYMCFGYCHVAAIHVFVFVFCLSDAAVVIHDISAFQPMVPLELLRL